jgi:cell division protein FtsI (penicillin-binding protein 3)
MSPDRVGYIQGYKDVGGNLILNEKIDKMLRSDGLNLRLNVNLGLQKQLEKILDNQKKELEADEIMAAVMDSKTGKVLSVASSNRYTQYKMSKDGKKNLHKFSKRQEYKEFHFPSFVIPHY